jgi:hypothetical protein
MRVALAVVMFSNAALLFFGAVQHLGIAIGRFHEPYILPAAIVEALCSVALIWGAAAVLFGSRRRWRAALVGNLIALGGVVLGKAALAAGAGPRTASNDFYHNIMLGLIGVSLLMLLSRVPSNTAVKKAAKPF